jgi:hypothetical protein
MNPLKAFARLLRIRDDQAEDALYNVRAAKLVLSRRSFIGVGAALATGAAFGFYKQLEYLPWNDPSKLYVYLENDDGVAYERVSVPRDYKHWEVQGELASLRAPAVFPAGTGSVKMKCSRITIRGAGGQVLCIGALNHAIHVDAGVTPIINVQNITFEAGRVVALKVEGVTLKHVQLLGA